MKVIILIHYETKQKIAKMAVALFPDYSYVLLSIMEHVPPLFTFF